MEFTYPRAISGLLIPRALKERDNALDRAEKSVTIGIHSARVNFNLISRLRAIYLFNIYFTASGISFAISSEIIRPINSYDFNINCVSCAPDSALSTALYDSETLHRLPPKPLNVSFKQTSK